MKPKSVLYAAVGAPVVAARKVGEQVSAFRGKVSKETASYSQVATKAIDGWAAEGEKVVNQISEGKVVEEISSKVDLDQAKEQVSKLRDQLEDMLSTWRASFRPEKTATVATANGATTTKTAAANKPATKAPAKKPAARKPAAKKPAAKKPATKSTAAKTATTAKTAARPAAKSSAAKTTKSSSATKKSSAKTPAAKAKTS